MLRPMEKAITMKEMIGDIADYLKSKNYNFVPVRLFEVNSGSYEEYKTLDDLKESYMFDCENENTRVIVYTFRSGYVYDESEECSYDVLALTYEVLEDTY